MSRFVLDASVALAWCFEDETSEKADRILDLLKTEEALVPVIWPVEVGNALLMGERRRRISRAEVTRCLELLSNLNIQVDSAAKTQVNDLVSLARSHKLTVYDAAYLDLAMRGGFALATLDSALAQACKAVGIRLLRG